MNRDEVLKAIEVLSSKYTNISTTSPIEDAWKDLSKAKRAAITALQAQLNDGWISIEERLPENPNDSDMEEYNVMIRGAKVPTSLTYTGKGKWWGDNYFYTVDYWQPLPQPPKQ